LALSLSLELVAAKMRGHHALLDRLPGADAVREEMRDRLEELAEVTTFAELRRTEGLAARAYWTAWQAMPIQIRQADRRRCPTHWTRFEARTSPFPGSKSPRRAVNPANAILNYLYALLEAEARIAALAVGLDPMVGLLHTDHTSRDSLALDLMEPARPSVDAWALDFFNRHVFGWSELFERARGNAVSYLR
jgi:CRISPR-associated endonuclease Cas1